MGQLQGGQLGQTAKGRKGDTNLHGGYLAIAPFSPSPCIWLTYLSPRPYNQV